MIVEGDNEKFFRSPKISSWLFRPTPDDSGQPFPGKILLPEWIGNWRYSALREVQYFGTIKEVAYFSATYNYEYDSTNTLQFSLRKNYCQLFSQKKFLERLDKIVKNVVEKNRKSFPQKFDIDKIVSSIAAFEGYAGKILPDFLIDKIVNLSFSRNMDFFIVEPPVEAPKKLAIRYKESLGSFKNTIVAETQTEFQTVMGKIMFGELAKIVEILKRDCPLEFSDSYGDR